MDRPLRVNAEDLLYESPNKLASEKAERLTQRHAHYQEVSKKWENFAAKTTNDEDYHCNNCRNSDIDFTYHIDRYARFLWKHYETDKWKDEYFQSLNRPYGSRSPQRYLHDDEEKFQLRKRYAKSVSEERPKEYILHSPPKKIFNVPGINMNPTETTKTKSHDQRFDSPNPDYHRLLDTANSPSGGHLSTEPKRGYYVGSDQQQASTARHTPEKERAYNTTFGKVSPFKETPHSKQPSQDTKSKQSLKQNQQQQQTTVKKPKSAHYRTGSMGSALPGSKPNTQSASKLADRLPAYRRTRDERNKEKQSTGTFGSGEKKQTKVNSSQTLKQKSPMRDNVKIIPQNRFSKPESASSKRRTRQDRAKDTTQSTKQLQQQGQQEPVYQQSFKQDYSPEREIPEGPYKSDTAIEDDFINQRMQQFQSGQVMDLPNKYGSRNNLGQLRPFERQTSSIPEVFDEDERTSSLSKQRSREVNLSQALDKSSEWPKQQHLDNREYEGGDILSPMLNNYYSNGSNQPYQGGHGSNNYASSQQQQPTGGFGDYDSNFKLNLSKIQGQDDEQDMSIDNATKARLNQLNQMYQERDNSMVNYSGIMKDENHPEVQKYLREFEKKYLDNLDRQGSPTNREKSRAQMVPRIGGNSPKRFNYAESQQMALIQPTRSSLSPDTREKSLYEANSEEEIEQITNKLMQNLKGLYPNQDIQQVIGDLGRSSPKQVSSQVRKSQNTSAEVYPQSPEERDRRFTFSEEMVPNSSMLPIKRNDTPEKPIYESHPRSREFSMDGRGSFDQEHQKSTQHRSSPSGGHISPSKIRKGKSDLPSEAPKSPTGNKSPTRNYLHLGTKSSMQKMKNAPAIEIPSKKGTSSSSSTSKKNSSSLQQIKGRSSGAGGVRSPTRSKTGTFPSLESPTRKNNRSGTYTEGQITKSGSKNLLIQQNQAMHTGQYSNMQRFTQKKLIGNQSNQVRQNLLYQVRRIENQAAIKIQQFARRRLIGRRIPNNNKARARVPLENARKMTSPEYQVSQGKELGHIYDSYFSYLPQTPFPTQQLIDIMSQLEGMYGTVKQQLKNSTPEEDKAIQLAMAFMSAYCCTKNQGLKQK